MADSSASDRPRPANPGDSRQEVAVPPPGVSPEIPRRETNSLPADPPADDHEPAWIFAAQAGDRSAYARLVDRYWDRLYRWLMLMTRDRHKAEDLTQETFLKALAALGSFREGTNFRAWLFRIAHNNFVNLKRAERKTTSALPEDPPGRDIHGPDETAAEREAIQVVRKAMDSLAPEFREAILLRIDEELSFRDIAEIMSITEETARWRVFKARRLLMKAIGSEIWSLNPEANSTDPS